MRINKNFYWAFNFVHRLQKLGVKHACITPGSRSTPLTIAFAENKKIKCHVSIDERSSAFIALGLAKATNSPVVVVTTSGTATAELYPAIIEAYQSRVPLIICTADRPPELIGTGANQTINQKNIYRNHIRWFYDAGIPSVKRSSVFHLQKMAFKAVYISSIKNRGPVHLNFPFRKPLEPTAFTDEVEKKIIRLSEQKEEQLITFTGLKIKTGKKLFETADKIINNTKGLILAGPMISDSDLQKQILILSSVTGYPVIADALSGLRFYSGNFSENIISNYHSFINNKIITDNFNPEIILHFGRTPTSSNLESFLSNCNAKRYLVSEFGDLFDPSRKTNSVIKMNSAVFCKELNKILKEKKLNRKNNPWLHSFISIDKKAEDIKLKTLSDSIFPNEPRMVSEIINHLPDNINLFIGNSLPVRDFDNFCSKQKKDCKLFFNRGASGIDGITSTAAGIALNGKPTLLITGDLSFVHDLSALITLKKFNPPLTIVIINNNGGGIFEALPVSGQNKYFKEYFVTPHNLNLKKISESFGLKHSLINSRGSLIKELNKSLLNGSPQIIEIKTDANKSFVLRKKYFAEVKKELEKILKL